MIITLTANPAIDQNFAADRLAFDDRAYLLERSEAAGGRGINASSVLHSLGASTLAVAPCGGAAGDRFEALLTSHGFPVELVRIRREIRTNYAITDRQGLTVKIDEPGPELDTGEVARLEAAVLDHLRDAEWLLLCGSLPPGVEPQFYRRLIERAREAGVRTLLDAGDAPMRVGIEARPTLVSPNQREAERFLDRALVIRSHFHEAVHELNALGAESVILSLGSRGLVAKHEDKIYEVVPPRVDAVCPIGAGDALNAACIWSLTKGHEFADSLRWGVAAGTASAQLPGLRFATLEQIEEVYARVEVRTAG